MLSMLYIVLFGRDSTPDGRALLQIRHDLDRLTGWGEKAARCGSLPVEWVWCSRSGHERCFSRAEMGVA